MKRLILTSLSGTALVRTDFVEAVIPFTSRLVWGPLPSPDEMATYVAARSELHGPGSHWSDFVSRWREGSGGRADLSLIEFCEPYEAIELWFDPSPDDQLQLIRLLDYFRSYPETVARLRLRLVDLDLTGADAKIIESGRVFDVAVTTATLETASMCWQAYRATTPEASFALLRQDLSALPLLRPAIADLIRELPSGATGLGATEMRVLELVASGYAATNSLFYNFGLRQRQVFSDWEIGFLLEGLAHGPKPVLAGFDDEIRTLSRENYRDRVTAYRRSNLSVTEFGKAVLAHQEDFSRHNPIDRWWGGTRLTNDCLWRRDAALIAPTRW